MAGVKKKKRRPKSRGYLQIAEGDLIEPAMRGFIHQCCDCALVHVINHYVKNGRVQFTTRRDNRRTAAARRAFNFTKEKD